MNFVNEVLELLRPDKIFHDIIQFEGHKLKLFNQSFEIKNNIHIFGVGKAASYEVQALKNIIKNSSLESKLGTCVAYTKRFHTVNDSDIKQFEGDHPLVSEENLSNTQNFISHLQEIPKDEHLIFLLSGGASALLESPIEGVGFELLKNIHQDLLNSGKNINEMNEIRKGLSKVKNGGLLHYIKTPHVIQLITCDIPNENLADVSSGPLIFQKLNLENINMFLETYSLAIGEAVLTPSHVSSILIQSASLLLKILEEKFQYAAGKIYDDSCENIIKDLQQNLPLKNQVLVSGGEGTLKIPVHHGKGGRNTHFVLMLAQELYADEKNQDIHIISFGTDGTDGPTDAAGAYLNFELFKTLSPNSYLKEFNSYEYFEQVGSLIKTGPTRNNLMDIRFLWRN